MLCPCGHAEIAPRDFRAYLRDTREARMAARMVVRGEAFGGAVMERRGKALYVGPERAEEEPEDGEPSRTSSAD